MSEISPIMLLLAIGLDAFGIFCIILTFTLGSVGIMLSFVPDALGLILIGGREFFMSRRKKFLKSKTVRKQGLKFAGTLIGEILPYVGALPFWTFYVIRNNS
jgi:hypothetical protein